MSSSAQSWPLQPVARQGAGASGTQARAASSQWVPAAQRTRGQNGSASARQRCSASVLVQPQAPSAWRSHTPTRG
jgi:hypothetical protein